MTVECSYRRAAVHPPQRRHLRRLERIFDGHRSPIFMLSPCERRRMPVLATDVNAAIICDALGDAERLSGWLVGDYVVMPDHVHFFATPRDDAAKSLSEFMRDWKKWTSSQLHAHGTSLFAWQQGFFDHLLRSDESYAQKWEYVRQNPVRAGLVANAEDWPYQGCIHILQR